MVEGSLWNSYSDENIAYPRLEGDIAVDIAIVGGGITGISTAQLLSERGYKVAVLEAKRVGKGTTSHSTGNLYVIIDQLLSSLKSKYNEEIVKKVILSRWDALKKIEQNIDHFQIDCDFKKQPLFLFEDANTVKMLEEKKVANKIDLAFFELSKTFPLDYDDGLQFEDQAQFNPLLYIQGLAKAIESENCKIYEHTIVRAIEEEEERVLVHTPDAIVSAQYAIHATHTPKGMEMQYHTTLGPYREYGIAAKLNSVNYPEGIFWGYYSDKKYSVRSYSRGGENYLIAVGSPHKVGQAKDNKEHVEDLKNFVQKRFDIAKFTHVWGGQNYKPADLLPYIGRKKTNSREFVATGFSTDGLVYGSLAAMILTDEIEGKFNPYEDIYRAARSNPGKSAEKFIKENANVAGEFLKDLSFKGDDQDLVGIPPGEAAIVTRNGEKIAVYKKEDGSLSILSALCTHMACMVHWNNLENSWDCPCHGSRFDTRGEVIEGPAFNPLKKIEIDK
ncbi:FAD-dependent oxidoreductase [Zunongwangia sp. F363]|uniref:FAD-dependent oxidoreductase n=1 Tax=Autumnicola tepida TaxID=3075595 RepID=A0ABU3CC46_9FLAO|nr:FAD-dependent oxidoreductase [Zunongwangia sp. F363]MDT0643911.1 FAD-dependent oxidoreductase [Zunongwangia sp. F363]